MGTRLLKIMGTWNQSMVQQLTSAGNLRMRVRSEVPAGDMASTMCSWSRTIDTKYAYSAVGLPSVCNDLSR